MIDPDVVDLSRLQFALTAMYHFLFVPLTLGLSILLAIMETTYVMTGKTIWKDMTRFWGKLFGINFAMGVATGITMEFQFGTNWSYYSHYVGDIFGAPLAIEGLMAFFLESSFVGLFFFGWDRLSKRGHLTCTWLVAIGSNLSALWILIANGWMQYPTGSEFNFETMRMELTSFYDIVFNPVAQAKFVHTVSSGYVTGAMFVLSISSWYLLRGRHIAFAKRSFIVAASFGLASALSVVVLGDESGYTVTEHQRMKLAAIEGMWETQPAPAGFSLFGIPDQDAQETHYDLQVPWMLGIIATRTTNTVLPGIKDLVDQAAVRIEDGKQAITALKSLRKDPKNQEALTVFNAHKKDMGYALLLRKFTNTPETASAEMVAKASESIVPHVPSLFWSFRLMVGLGFYFILAFGFAFYMSAKLNFEKRWFLTLMVLSLPLPWLAAELGWFVAEHGRQPWAIEGILPTFMAASSVSSVKVIFTLVGFFTFYSALAVIDIFLMRKYIIMGPVEALDLVPSNEEQHAQTSSQGV